MCEVEGLQQWRLHEINLVESMLCHFVLWLQKVKMTFSWPFKNQFWHNKTTSIRISNTAEGFLWLIIMPMKKRISPFYPVNQASNVHSRENIFYFVPSAFAVLHTFSSVIALTSTFTTQTDRYSHKHRFVDTHHSTSYFNLAGKHVDKVPHGLTVSGHDICIWQESHQTGLIPEEMEG